MPAITRSSSSRRVKRDETIVPQRVERHVHAREARGTQIVRDLGQLHAVGREREVDAERGEHLDQSRHVRAHQRLAAGQPDRLEPEALHAQPHHPGDLLVGEHLRAREPAHTLGRHAVGAPEVAAVGDRDPEVLDHTPVAVDQRPRRRRRGAGRNGNGDPGHPFRVGVTDLRGPRGRVRSRSPPAQRPTSADGSKLPRGAVSRQPRARLLCNATRFATSPSCVSPATAIFHSITALGSRGVVVIPPSVGTA